MEHENIDENARYLKACENVKKIVNAIKNIKMKYYTNFAKISSEDKKVYEQLNKNLEITSEGLAIIPTEWRTEIFCYEFKGKVDNTDFLVYINAKTGREENILVIINTPDGILTQ